MKNLLTLAWRNIWRNKRRTIISISSVFFSVILALFMRSLQEGSYALMIDTSVRFYAGYVQVQDKGYWENKSINRLLEDNDSLRRKILAIDGVNSIMPRFENGALAAAGNITRGAMVIGIDPEAEDAFNDLSEKLVSGEYLKLDDQSVMVAEGLAEYLEIGLGDTIVLIGQGYRGNSATGKYAISAMVKYPNPIMNRSLLYMPLPIAQELHSAPGLATAFALDIKSANDLQRIKTELAGELGDEFDVMTWSELQPELEQIIESDRGGGIITIGILYTIIAFGIFGTMMMMAMERRRECGVLVAIGMDKWKLNLLFMMESLMIGFVSVVIALLAGFPLVYYFQLNPIRLSGDIAASMEVMGVEPIIPTIVRGDIFLTQGWIVMIVFLVALWYPLYMVRKLKLVEALR